MWSSHSMVVLLAGALVLCQIQGVTAASFRTASAKATHPSPCNLSVYSIGIKDEKPGMFVLPHGEADDVEVRPCVFKGASYKDGEMKFKCGSSGWSFAGHTCKGRSEVADQCVQTTHKFTMNGNPGNFLLPLGNPGTVQEAPCEFLEERYLKGKVVFKCSDGKWKQESYTCSEPSSGRCPATKFSYKLGEHQVSLDLPKGDKDSTTVQACEFEGKTYERGELKFACEAGKWKYSGHTCSDRPAGGCAAIKYTVKVSDHSGDFMLPNEDNGEKKDFPCKFTDKVYDEGVMTFSCADGKWGFTGHSCA